MTSPALNAELTAEQTAKRDRLLALLAGYESCLVAFSGGVDSAVVAKAAQLALGERALAITGVSASLAADELPQATALAGQIGIRHAVLATDELNSASYRRNAPDRCYHCKTELYTRLEQVAAERGIAVVASGANADDLGEYRPGLQAAEEHRVRHPLAECELTKADVRALAAHWGLPVWSKPATPCLSSRVAYGEEVTPARLRMIDEAERFLRTLGLVGLRVRYHRGDLARIEVPLAALPTLCEPAKRASLTAKLRSLGFRYVTLDLEGFRSGSQNEVLPIEVLAGAQVGSR